MTQKMRYRRRIKLIKPRLQIRLVGTFMGISALSFLLQGLLLAQSLARLATSMPTGGHYVLESMAEMLFHVLLLSFGVFMPLTFAIGVLVTFRIAGPIYRFEQYLGQVARGEAVGPCRIRSSDDLHELCAIINQALERIQVDDESGGTQPVMHGDGKQPTLRIVS